MSGKAILSIGGTQRNRTVEYCCLATGKSNLDDVNSRFLLEYGGREMCGDAVLDNTVYMVGGCCGSKNHRYIVIVHYSVNNSLIHMS